SPLFRGNGHAAPLGGDLNPDQRPLQRHGRAVPVNVGVRRRKPLPRAFERRPGPLDVDLLGALRNFREHRHASRGYLGESANHRKRTRAVRVRVAVEKLPDTKLGHQRRVTRQDTQAAFRAGQLHFHHAVADQLPLRRHHHQLQGFGKHLAYTPAFIFSAFSIASTISWNPRTVSSIFTYLPSRPVNCAATNIGCGRNFSIFRARATVSLSSSESSSIPRIAMMSCKSL